MAYSGLLKNELDFALKHEAELARKEIQELRLVVEDIEGDGAVLRSDLCKRHCGFLSIDIPRIQAATYDAIHAFTQASPSNRQIFADFQEGLDIDALIEKHAIHETTGGRAGIIVAEQKLLDRLLFDTWYPICQIVERILIQ